MEEPSVAPTPTRLADRIAERAARVRFVKVLLTILAFPFFVIGVLAALVWLLITWSIAAIQVGFVEMSDRRRVNDGAG